MNTKDKFLGVIVSIYAICGMLQYAQAKSVYAITDHGLDAVDAWITAYGISEDQIEIQTTIDMSDYPMGSYRGPVGLAIDSTGCLFVTHESATTGGIEGIQIIDAISLTDLGVLEVEGAPDFAGIAYDNNRNRVYAIVRDSNDLHVFDWYADTQLLVEDAASPVQLAQVGNWGCGLALDEETDTLYVSTINDHTDYSNQIFCYDANDWSYLDTIEITSNDTDYTAVAVAVYNDGAGANYLYTGAYALSGAHSYLVKTDLNLYESDPNDPNAMIAKYLGINTSAIGIAVDPDTGLVYVTQSDNKVAVYDTSDWINDPNDTNATPTDSESYGVSGPAGICVPMANINYKPSIMGLSAISDANETCVYPVGYGDPCYVEYTVCYSGGGQGNQTGTFLTAYLPFGVEPLDPNDEHYFWQEHAFIWDLGTVAEDANDCVSFEIYVEPYIEPLGSFTIEIELESDTSFTAETVTTQVCCWGGDIIYVDETADSLRLGTSWQHAYSDLQDALYRASQGCGDEIWVAKGTYTPGTSSGDKFIIPSGVAVYGGFAGNEDSLNDRNYIRNLTVLSGDDTCSTIVSAANSNSDTTIDGFIISQAAGRGIDCDNANLNILNCIIADNASDGIYIDAGQPYISKCDIYDNGSDGIYTTSAATEIKNSLIHHNGDAGIVLGSPSDEAIIHNNTICYNATGISRTGGTAPDIRNCIIYGNTSDQVNGATAEYSCIEDPNATPSCEPDGSNNITADPCFAYDADETYNFHLSTNSCCIDTGDNTYVEPNEVDIDGDDRILDGDDDQTATVDMGADELACTDVSHNMDFNGDGIINGDEFYIFATAWQSQPGDDPNDPNTPNWNADCDFHEDETIDIIDFCVLAKVWLWQACYYNDSYLPMLLRTTGQGYTPLSMAESMAFTSFSTASSLTSEPADTMTDAELYRIWQQLRPPYNPSLGQRIIQLKEIISWLKQIWYADDGIQQKIDEEDFWDFVEAVEAELTRMEEEYLQTHPVESE